MNDHTHQPVDLVELRDRFALAALPGLLATERLHNDRTVRTAAYLAYLAADAMLQERAKHDRA